MRDIEMVKTIVGILFFSFGLSQAPSSLNKKIDKFAKSVEKKVIDWRRDFHEHPELSNREFKTAEKVAKHLRSLGMEVQTEVAHTGVVGILKGGKPGKVVALRADMDALPVKEKVDPRDYKIWVMTGSSRGRAKKEGLPYDIDEEYLKNLGVPEVCPVLGIPLDWNSDKTSDNSPSLDKFYPDKGYVKGNVQIVSYRANRLKNDGSPEEWLRIAEWCQQEDVRRKLSGDT